MSHITHESIYVNNKAIGFQCQKIIHKLVDQATKQLLLAPIFFFFFLIKKPRNDSPKWAAGVTAQPQTGRSSSPHQTQIHLGGLYVGKGLHIDLSGWDVLIRKVAKLGLL